MRREFDGLVRCYADIFREIDVFAKSNVENASERSGQGRQRPLKRSKRLMAHVIRHRVPTHRFNDLPMFVPVLILLVLSCPPPAPPAFSAGAGDTQTTEGWAAGGPSDLDSAHQKNSAHNSLHDKGGKRVNLMLVFVVWL